MIVSTNEISEKESVKMNKQEKLNWWERELSTLNVAKGGYVSAGEMARAVNMSRNTAQKYMFELVESGRAVWALVNSRNGNKATLFHVSGGAS